MTMDGKMYAYYSNTIQLLMVYYMLACVCLKQCFVLAESTRRYACYWYNALCTHWLSLVAQTHHHPFNYLVPQPDACAALKSDTNIQEREANLYYKYFHHSYDFIVVHLLM